MSLRRILFVDDEVHVLDGLQNMLRKQRRVWDMTFTLGGPAALEALAKERVDVIVTDMRMPGMDGSALLEKVRDAYPTIARIVLSGHAEPGAVMRSLPVAHQFLSKPCDADVLFAVIERTCNLQALLHDDAARRAVGLIGRLPSAAHTYGALTTAVRDPDIGTAALAHIIEEDPAMSAKVLQLVNSAYFGLGHRVTSIQQAVRHLGVELIKGLVLSAEVFGVMEKQPIRDFSVEELQEHSLLTARVATQLVADRGASEEAFAAAIIHDVGQIVLAQAFPARFATILDQARESGRMVHEVERESLGVSHGEVGAYLLGVWGLPFSIIEAVAYHHHPGRVTVGARDVLAAVHVADALVEEAASGRTDGPSPRGLDLDFLQAIGWPIDVAGWRSLARTTRDTARRRPVLTHS